MTDSSAPEEERPTSIRRVVVIVLIIAVVSGIGVFLFTSRVSPPVATITIFGLGSPSATDVALSPGAKVSFAVHADDGRTNGTPDDALLLRIELLDGKKVTLVKECVGVNRSHLRSRRDQRATKVSATYLRNDCDLTVPASGADLVQATARWENGGRGLQVNGLSILVFVE